MITIYHNEGYIPKIIGIYVDAGDTSTENTYRYDMLKVVGITEIYFKILLYKLQESGSYGVNISYI